MPSRLAGLLATLLIASLSVFYQLNGKHTIQLLGLWRKVEAIGNQNCESVPQLEACEKLHLHQPTGLVYLACSTRENRGLWTPAVNHLNESGSGKDYFAIYNPQNGKITRITLDGLTDDRRFSSHGFDLVPSAENPKDLWVYAINHRRPRNGPASQLGADSVVEIFKTRAGSNHFTWVKSMKSQHMHTPNEIVGDPSGKSFHWTNDHGSKTGWMRALEGPLRLARTSIGYCHINRGCKIAIAGLAASNGLARARNGTFYVGSIFGYIQSLELQKDGSLTLGDRIQLDRAIDNLSLDHDGALYAAGFPKLLPALQTFSRPEVIAPSSALRITLNTGRESFFGEKYKIETIFENDGVLLPAFTSVAYDTKRNRLFMHGITTPFLMICKL